MSLSLANKILRIFGLVITKEKNLRLIYQHDYGKKGFFGYREIQIYHNKRKINKIWADEKTLQIIADYTKKRIPVLKSGICHGTRNGFEQRILNNLLGIPIIGTEISDTAKKFPNTIQWDFHEQNPQWKGGFSLVYSNALDQAFNPKKALETWVEQLQEDGLLFIEHSMSHSASGASEMDPFGAHPMVMPYLFFDWGKDLYKLKDILRPPYKKAGKYDLWIFVISKEKSSN